ncbi:RagB/SusD family nutrient uptake outer membrane protein [Xylanibacter caecicola]|uniref:RagB/SusD family nutrient uptake outer membrane protein n=1 Tax=Xylanibacter caecicola TaxID=2736294 RepID=UPI00258B331F|nr:RagB/SusD family nutrient uptake outer membrane protein [Xylanibacter caecicola]
MKKNNIKIFCIALASVMSLTSCSDSFLEDKKNNDNVGTEIYEFTSGCNGRLNDLYSWCLPAINGQSSKYSSDGSADICGKSTEEYSGFSDFVNPQIELSSMSTTNSVPDYFMNNSGNIQEAVYGRIRNINDFIGYVEAGPISQEDKDVYLGQAYFLRAWCYYNLLKWYGGVPIVTEVLEASETSLKPRSSAKACVTFILDDLQKSATMLAAKTKNGGWKGSDYGRVTTGTALALKGRVLLLWASPLFNRANDMQRWTNAYEAMQKDLADINACGYGLYNESGNINGSAFANMFLQSKQNPEAVFVTLYNNVQGDGLDNQKNNRWERDIRPANTGGGGKNASAMLVDMFPMADGKIPATVGTYTKLETSSITYENDYPFMNRDPRFYRTFALPGFRWAYNGNASEKDKNNPADGKNYVLWNYVWYKNANDMGNAESGSSYAADNLGNSKVGVYVRKKSDDADVNGSPLYNYVANDTKGAAPFYSAAPLIELRYAEVLLNLAEVACGAEHMDVAVGYLQKIRERAGYTAENNYGLQSNLASDQAACMSAILYERQIEFAYEGKRFDDLRRWMLFDGGTERVAGAPNTWTLTGWGGNTCTWLGFKPLNGQRRENMEFRTADKFGTADPEYGKDPLIKAGVERYKGVDFRLELTSQLTDLKTWYKNNLVRKMKKGDGRDANHTDLYMNFRARYYFLGLCSGAMNATKGIQQTIGWEDYNNGGANGTFDPLAENSEAE